MAPPGRPERRSSRRRCRPATTACVCKGTSSAADYVSFGRPGLGASTFTVETWFKRDGAGVDDDDRHRRADRRRPARHRRAGTTGPTATNLDLNYFLGLSGNVLAADFEEGAGGPDPRPQPSARPGRRRSQLNSVVPRRRHLRRRHAAAVPERRAGGGGPIARPARADSIEHAAIGTALNSTGVAAGFFAGTVDEVRIWNYAPHRRRRLPPARIGKSPRPAACSVAGASTSAARHRGLVEPECRRHAVRLELDVGGRRAVDGTGQRRARRSRRAPIRRSRFPAAALLSGIVHRRRPERHAGDDAVEQDERSRDRDVR